MSQDSLVLPLTQADHEMWNAFVLRNPHGHLMQFWEWGDFKQAEGWQVQRIGICRQGDLIAGVQVLFLSLPSLPVTIAYVPKGPMIDLADHDALDLLLSTVHRVARQQRAIYLMIEPEILDAARVHDLLTTMGFYPSPHTNQPRSTIIIDLRAGEDAVFANMRHETRKLIRRAARNGVQVCEGSEKDLGAFYSVLRATAEIKGFSIHAASFYSRAWSAFRDTGRLKLFLAKCGDQVVAAKMVAVFGNTSLHLWGGTTSKGREVNASYLIQWEALRWEIAHGCEYADLWGIPDEVSEMLRKGEAVSKDKTGGLWGVYTFKRGFGGEVRCYVGAYHYVYNPLLYKLGMAATRGAKSVDAIAGWLERIAPPPKAHAAAGGR